MKKSTERFTQTVQDYVKYRPSYPKEILRVLEQECGLTKKSIIADVGSGTGLFAQLLLDHGNIVYGIEPNKAMRLAAENYLKKYKHFISVDATSEKTPLGDHSVDLITAATAFHWFDAHKTKKEFQRILKENGWVMLIWNVRDLDHSALIRDYEALIIKYGDDYHGGAAEKFNKQDLESFFSPHSMHTKSFPYVQQFDWKGFQGRLLSASYIPREGAQNYNEMISELKNIFDRYQKNGKIEFLYSTKIYYGHLN